MQKEVLIVNLEEDSPSADLAVFCLDKEIEYSRYVGIKAIIAIHGYGSNGCGGEIKKSVHTYLKDQLHRKNIKGYVKGEQWGSESISKFDIINYCPSLILNEQITNNNSGITIIFV